MSSPVASDDASSLAIDSGAISVSVSAPAAVIGSSSSGRLSFAFSSVSGRKTAVSGVSSSRLLSNDDAAEAASASSSSPAVRVRDDSGQSFSALSSLATPASAAPLVIPLRSSLSWRDRQTQYKLEQDRLRVEAAAASPLSASASPALPQPAASPLPSLVTLGSDPQYTVAVSEFGSAMLRGMGWRGPGDAVGGVNRADVQPVILKQRGDRAGLGAERAADAGVAALPPHLQPKSDERPQQSQAGNEGRKEESVSAQLRLKAGDRLLKLEAQQLKVGSLVSVVAGQWRRQYGRVEAIRLAAGGDGGRLRCEVRLQAEERSVELQSDELEVLDEHALPDEHPARRGARNGSHRRGRTETTDRVGRGERKEAVEASEQAAEREASKRQKTEHRDAGNREANSTPRSSSPPPRPPRSSPPSSHRPSSSSSPPRSSSWCVPSLHVRLVSRSLSPASLYRSKAVVLSVLDASHISVVLDDGAQRLDGLREEQLETVVSGSRGSRVQVVRGRRRGRRGEVLSKDADRERVRVRLEGDSEAVELHLDDVCELMP